MDDKITTFLNSGLLEKYLLGNTTSIETEFVETHISRYPEIENTYNTLQFNLEVLCKSNAIEAPKNALNNILDDINNNKPVVKLNSSHRYKKWYKLSIAACIAALLFAAYSFTLYDQKLELSNENQVIVDEIFDLRSDIDYNNKMLDDVMKQLLKLNNPETEKYIIKGNERAKNLKTVAYINPKEKTSMIDVVSLPELPEEQYYQMWAELQDKMVSLGILDKADRKLRKIPYMKDALGISITIESKEEDNDIASIKNPVAQISLQ